MTGVRVGPDQHLTDAEIIAAIRARHLVCDFERNGDLWLDWDHAFVDGLGGAPYLHVPVLVRKTNEEYCVTRVYAPARLGRRLTHLNGYRWGSTWRVKSGVPEGWGVRVGEPYPL